MNLIVMKFGGSSVADNNKLKIAAEKIISFLQEDTKVVVIVSAQGNTTDKLLEQAKELSMEPNKRELDMLLSTGEQISCSKLAILLNEMNHKATSMTGWQAGIVTDSNHTQAKIQDIYTNRIYDLLETNEVVVIAGFQGVDENQNITTLGRDGSDTTAVAICAALEQEECYIFTDTDGVYDKDPNKYKDAKIIKQISYDDMMILVQNGAKVLHDRCIKIAKKYDIKIIVTSPVATENKSIVCST